VRNIFASVRGRYFGPRPLSEDGSVGSKATALVNLESGYKSSSHVRLSLDIFNLLDAADSDIDYFYASRLRGEPAERIEDIHLHPTLPRTMQVALTVGL